MMNENEHLIDLFLDRRGLTYESYSAFDAPLGETLHNIDEMVERLHDVHEAGTHITVLPDFDMDGIMSGVTGLAGLSELGFDVSLFIPDPTKGYGFNSVEIDRLLVEHSTTQTIITCDTGITCVDGCRHAKERGISVLLTDHHTEIESESVRDYVDCVVDPCALDDPYTLKGICGAHVLWQILMAYANRYADVEVAERIERLRVFAGIGTVSDVMPLAHENRQIVRDAVSLCRLVWSKNDPWFVDIMTGCDTYRKAFRGLYEILACFSDNRAINDYGDISEEFFGFYLAPTFNSCKRLGKSMNYAFGAFFADDQASCVRSLYEFNTMRKTMVRDALAVIADADNMLAPYVYYLSGAEPGILGLLASNLCDSNEVPCIVVNIHANGTASGSGRSPDWYPCLSRLRSAGFNAKGHEGAFGFSCDSLKELCRLYDFFASDVPAVVAQYQQAIKDGSVEVPETKYDFVIDNDGHGDTTIDFTEFKYFMDDLETYRPFGQGFPSPHGVVRFKSTDALASVMGRDGSHLRLTLPYGFTVLCFGQADKVAGGLSGNYEVEGDFGINNFMGRSQVQFRGTLRPVA